MMSRSRSASSFSEPGRRTWPSSRACQLPSCCTTGTMALPVRSPAYSTASALYTFSRIALSILRQAGADAWKSDTTYSRTTSFLALRARNGMLSAYFRSLFWLSTITAAASWPGQRRDAFCISERIRRTDCPAAAGRPAARSPAQSGRLHGLVQQRQVDSLGPVLRRPDDVDDDGDNHDAEGERHA